MSGGVAECEITFTSTPGSCMVLNKWLIFKVSAGILRVVQRVALLLQVPSSMPGYE